MATDGAPDRCENPNAHDRRSRRISIDAVQAAHADGIDTFPLLVDGEETPCDDPGGGWRAVDETTLELLGTLCDDLKAGRVRSIEGRFPCDSVILR